MPNNLPKPGDILNKSSLPKPSDVLAPVKKKEATSAPKKKAVIFSPVTDLLASTSATSKQKTAQKPSASSGGKAKQQVFTGYPGKEDKKYILDESTGKQIWKETVSGGKLVNGKAEFKIEETPITDPSRVVALNKQFNKNASTDVNDQVFTGYPGKELNEYRINNGTWQRRQPKATSWTDLNQKNTIDALNSQFKKSVKYYPAKAKFDLVTEDENAQSKKDLDSQLLSVNSKLIGGQEEDAVRKLSLQFPGFRFLEQGAFTDEILVIAPNDKRINISLDNWTHDDDINQSSSLREFIKANSNASLDKAREKMINAEAFENQWKIKPVDIQIKLGDGAGEERELMGLTGTGTSIEMPEKDIVTANVEAKLARSEYFKKTKETFQEVNDRHREAIRTTGNIDNIDVRNAYANLDNDMSVSRSLSSYMDDIADQNKSIVKEFEYLQTYTDNIKDKVASGEISEDEFNTVYAPKIEQGIASINSRSESLNNDVNTSTANENAINKSLAENLIVNASKGSFGGGIANNLATGLTDILRLGAGAMGANSSDTKKLQTELVRSIVGTGTTEEYMASEERSDISKTLFSLAKSMGQLATGGVAGKLATGAGATAKIANLAATIPFYAGGYYEMKDQFDDPSFSGVSDAEKVLLSTLYGTASGILEKYGLTKALGKTPMGKGLTNRILKASFKDLPKNASSKMVELSIENSIKKQLVSRGVNTIGAYLVEASTEAAQELTQVGLQEVYDLAKGNNYFKNGTGWDIASRVWESALLGGLGGGIMGTVSQSYGMFKDRKKLNNVDSVKLMQMTYNDANMRDLMLTNIKNKILNKEITAKEGKAMFQAVQQTASILTKLPDNLNDEQTLESVNLLVERTNIEKEIEGKDVNLVATQKARVAEINNELTKISEDATKESNVQEVTTEGSISEYQGASEGQQEVGTSEGSQRETTQPSTDRGDSTVAGEVQQEKIVVDKPTITTNATTEVDRVKSLTDDVEDGATLNLDGSKYDGVGLVVPVDSVNTTREELTPEMIADFVEERQEMIGDAGVVKAGVYKFPNSNQVSIDLNVVVPETSRELAIEFGRLADQESLFDLGTGENVKTGGTGKNPMKFTPEQHREIATALKEGRMPNVFGPTVEQEVEAIGQLLSGTDQEIDTKITNKKIVKAVAKAKKALSKIIPGTKFVVHDTIEEYKKAVGEDDRSQASNGTFDIKKNTIHINGTSANARTIAHEVFHAILINKVKTDKNAADVTKRMIESISPKVSTEINKKLNDFISNYEENIQNEEKLSELVGMLAENYNSFSTSVKDIITRWIDKLANIFGLDPFDRNETYDMLKTIARKVAKGKEISEADMMSITGVTTNIIESTEPRKQVKVSKDQKLTFVTKEDLIDIDSLISDISSKKQKVWFWVADQLGRGNYFDSVLNGEHFLDAGPSFALDPENRSKNVIWASGAKKIILENNIAKSDYIFIISGSPQRSKLFNKTVANLIRRRIEGAVKFNDFKKELLEAKPTAAIKSILEKYNSYEDLFMGADRKNFIIAINEQQTKNTTAKKVLEKYNAFVDPNDLRDGFYQDNNFDMGDIMLVLKADKLGEKSNHSTYETDVLGKVIGVPDKVINAYDIMPSEIKDKYRDDMSRSEQSQVVAPYGIGIKEISPRIDSQSLAVENMVRKQLPVAGNKLFNAPLPQATVIANRYAKSIGIKLEDVNVVNSLNEYKSKAISNEFDKMKDDPTDPKVSAAYKKMAQETIAQYKEIIKDGYFVEINNEEPYSSSEDMISDLNKNKRFKVFSTESGFGDTPITEEQRKVNPLLKDSGFKDVNGIPLLVNDVFRFVHDFFGHAKIGNSFGPIGEENAWKIHSVMYSPLARRAMTSETRGQNSFVNFSGINEKAFKLRDKARELRKNGDIEKANELVGEVYDMMKFADQKIGLMPDWVSEIDPENKEQLDLEAKAIEETIAPRKQKPKTINDIVKLTKDQGFSDAAIRQYLKDQGYTEKNINDAIEPEKNRMFNEAEGVFEKSQDRGRDTKEALQNSIDYIQTSLWYENATDIEREQAIRDFRKYKSQKEKAAPSIAKVLGTQKPETVTMFIKTLRNEFIKAKAQAANIAVRDIKNKQRSIVVAINQMKRQGSISAAQAASLAKRLAYLNVDNPIMVSRYLEYAERLFNNADYQEQLSKAFKLRKSIRRVLKNNQAQVAGMAKDFTNIDPSMMDDVQSYIENAEKIMSALKRSVSDTKFVLKEAVNISEMNQFTEDTIIAQDAKIKKEKLAEYQDLVDQGIISEDMELKDIIEVIKSIEGTEIKDKQKKEAELRKYVNKMFDFYSTYINRMLKDGAVDQFSGEELNIDEKSKVIIKQVLAIDINEMSLTDAYSIVESINNFIVNGITDGLEASVRKFNGAKNASDFAKTGIKAKPLRVLFIKGISRIQAYNFTTLPVLIDRMFGGVRTGLQFTKAMGLNEFENGVAKADTVHTKIVDEYGKEFSKKNMLGRLVWKMSNGEAFNSAMNTYERGMLAYLKRTLIGTDLQQQNELKRRISLIKESINTLNIDGDEKQKKMGEIYEELFNKLGLEESNPNILDIESRVDPTNRAAVKWWTDKWSEHYSDLYDVSLAVYNTQLGKDLNYTPDRYSKVNNETFLLDSNEDMGSFGVDLGLVTDKNKAGVLMESNKNFGTLLNRDDQNKSRFVNLDFDMSNSNSMKAALIDINTAAPIVQMASFMNSKAMNKIIEVKEDREILKTRINNYIRQSKHKSFTTDKSFNEANKFLDSISAIGTAKALGTVMAPLLQTVPVLMNTMINTGRTFNLFDLVSDRDYHKWLSSSGMPIVNRGLESSSQISSGNKYLEKVANSKGAQLTSAIRDLNKFYLKNFLAKPDVYIARASWKAYYIKDLKHQGIDTRGIDWNTHKINQDAADYAQHMVDRQQNVSDPMLMGDFMSSSDSTKKAIRKILLPFANFILNQKTRMASDLRTLSSSTSIKEDKIAAAKSMTGLLVEIAAFNAMGIVFKELWGQAAAALMGYDEPEEEKEKRKGYTKEQFGVNLIKDLLSPHPWLDGVTVAAANEITSKIQDFTYSKEDLKLAVDERNTYLESRDKDPMDAKTEKEFRQQWIDEQKLNFEQYNSEKFISAGSLTIMLDKAIEFKELVEVASTGKYTKEYNGNEVEKVLLPEDQKKLDLAVWLDGLYLAGLLPREGGTIAKKMLKVAENRGLTESQYEEYKAIKKATGDVDGYKLDLMKSTMSIDNVITEIEWVENNGGLTREQSKVYTKVRYILKDVDAQTLKKIQRGMTAEQITK